MGNYVAFRWGYRPETNDLNDLSRRRNDYDNKLDIWEIGSDEADPTLSTSDWKQWREQDCRLSRKPREGASNNSNYITVIPAWGLDTHHVK
jgi:hypothetical protein